MANFKEIMVHLNPRVIIEKTEVPHDNARGNCTLESSVVSNFAEFKDIITAYIIHHSDEVFGSSPEPEFAFNMARKFLEELIGFDNAVFLGLSGSEGGMFNVINLLCEGFKKEAKQAYFGYVVDSLIDPLNFEDTVELMRELKQKLGNYSPDAFGYIQPEAMAANYKDILWRYIESLGRYRNLWNY